MKDQFRLRDKMNNSVEFRRARKSMRCAASLETFQHSTELLMDAMKAMKYEKGAMISPDGKRLPVAFFEVHRNFFNFTVSALAMLDHLKDLDEEIYSNASENRRPHLSALLKNFKASPTFQLMHGIRQYLNSYGIPNMFIGQGEFAFETKSLMLWQKWTEKEYKAALEVLQKNPGIHLHALALNYRGELQRLFTLYDNQQGIHLKLEYEIHNRLLDEWNGMINERVSETINDSLRGEQSTAKDMEINLLICFPPDLWERIQEAKSITERSEGMITSLRELGIEFSEDKMRQLYLRTPKERFKY